MTVHALRAPPSPRCAGYFPRKRRKKMHGAFLPPCSEAERGKYPAQPGDGGNTAWRNFGSARQT
jgi:hypothetical protein